MSQKSLMDPTSTGSARSWRNWSGSVACTPQNFARPSTIEELRKLVLQASTAGGQVRVVGAGHSFTPSYRLMIRLFRWTTGRGSSMSRKWMSNRT
nr:hypothetical protein [Ktedonobacter robiniae]